MISGGEVTLLRYVNDYPIIELPEEIDGFPVTGLAGQIYFNMLITSVELPETVVNIGAFAFTGTPWFDSLWEDDFVIINDVLIKSNLTGEVEIPEGVASIAGGAFNQYVTGIVVPSTVTRIDDFAFAYLSGLETVVLPDTITSIGNGAFAECRSLVSVNIPYGVTSIGAGAFSGCVSLPQIYIPPGVTAIGDSAFAFCTSLGWVVIPDGATFIGDRAFFRCESIREVIVPESVVSIGTDAFAGTYWLENIQASEEFVVVNGILIRHNGEGDEAEIPYGVVRINRGAFSPGITSVAIPEGVAVIGGFAFAGFGSLTFLHIPASVAYIGDGAFFGAVSLQAVYFYGNAPHLGAEAFANVHEDFTIYHNPAAEGWTSPWHGYYIEEL
jgi:hypothetical protein